jgi:hypothetical protein
MSDILIAKELRARFTAALVGAGITAGVVPVNILTRAPVGMTVPEKQCPALYVFNSGEAFQYQAIDEVERTLFLDVVLMGRGDDAADQLDDMQLAVEVGVIAADGFGLARSVRPVSVEIAQAQGAVMFGTRVIKFEIVFGVTPGDPSL